MKKLSSSLSQHAALLSMLAAASLAILLYQRALGFAFFNDDPSGHFAWMESRSLWQLFTSSAGYGFYRPVSFALWKLLRVLMGGYYAPAFHAFSLLLHGANVAMLWLLAFRLSGSTAYVYAWLAALAFATFPFNYEAVAYVASLFHPLLAFWALLALLFYWHGRHSSSRLALAPAHLALLMGLFSHENGLFIAPALVALEWFIRPPRSLSDAVRRPFRVFFIAPALFLLLWFSIPKIGEQGLRAPTELFSNTIPFLQTLIYPLLPFWKLDSGDVVPLFVLVAAVLLVTYTLAQVTRLTRLWMFALAWVGFSAVPSSLFLEPGYLYGSPRLHYLPSLGVALFYATPALALAELARAPGRRLALYAVQVGFALTLLWPPLSFIRCQLDFYAQASHIAHTVRQSAEAAPAGYELLFINLPFFFSSYAGQPEGCPSPYPWTPQGAVVIPPYANVDDFIRINGGPDRPARGASFTGYAPGWQTYGEELAPEALRDRVGDSYVYVFDLMHGSLFDLSHAWRPHSPPASQPLASFGDLDLIETAIEHVDGVITIELQWQVHAAPPAPITAFVHLYDPSGLLIAQQDAPPAQGYAPPPLWQAGDTISDVYTLAPAPQSQGDYTLAVGLYDSLTGERLPATTAGVPLPDNVYILEQFTCCATATR